MAETVTVAEFGRGRDISRSPSQLEPGFALDSLNLRHASPQQAEPRGPIDRVWATRPNGAAPTLFAGSMTRNVTGTPTTYRLMKQGSKFYSFTLTPTDAATELLTGLDSTHLPGFAALNGLGFLADWQAANYVTIGVTPGTHELQKSAPTGVMTLASAGTATGNTAATITYWYTDVDAYTGAESPPSAAVTVSRSADQGVTLSNSSLSFTSPWTTKNIYRTVAGDPQPYKILSGKTSGNFPISDLSLDTTVEDDGTNASTVHDDAGSASIDKPAGAKHACAHRGRLFLANFSGATSRVRWSKPLEPTQFSNASQARFDVGRDDGGEITGLVSFRGSLVVFKTNSIWVMNGDLDEVNFTFSPAVTGVGCVAPRTIVKDGDARILFLSACGVYSYDLSQAVRVSDRIHDDVCCLNFASRADFMTAGLDICEREYILSVSPSGASTNTKTHVLNLLSGAWSRRELAMGVVVPSCYSDTADVAPIKNATGSVKLYVGDESGYLYETDSSGAVGDGVTSGTVSATVTSYSTSGSGIITASAATFRTTGNGLTGLSVTLRRLADSTYETRTIASATGTAVTLASGSWTGAAPVAGDTILIGSYRATLDLGRIGGAESTRKKRWVRGAVLFEKETTAPYPLRFGYTLDGDTAPTATTEVTLTGGFRASRSFDNRKSVAIRPYLDMIGPSLSFKIVLMEIQVVPFERHMPTRT